MSIEIFQYVGGSFDNATAHFVTSTSTRLIKDIRPLAITGISLFLTCYFYLIIAGRVQEPFTDFLLKCLKIILISAFALNANNYLEWVVKGFEGFQSGLASSLSHTSPDTNFYQTLDKTLGKGIDLIDTCMEKVRNSGWKHLGDAIAWFANGILIAIGILPMTIVGGVMVLVASLLFKLVMAVGPLFIMCLMWPFTARFFDAWFGQALTYLLKIVFIGTIMVFCIDILNELVKEFDLNSSFSKLAMCLQTILSCYILYKVIQEVGGLASSLAGGVSSAAMSLGQVASAAAAPFKLPGQARNLLDPVQTRRDAQTGFMVSQRRSAHLLQGNTAFNPAYLRRLKESVGKNWKRNPGGKVKSA